MKFAVKHFQYAEALMSYPPVIVSNLTYTDEDVEQLQLYHLRSLSANYVCGHVCFKSLQKRNRSNDRSVFN